MQPTPWLIFCKQPSRNVLAFFKKALKIGLDVGSVSPVVSKEPLLGFANVSSNLGGEFSGL